MWSTSRLRLLKPDLQFGCVESGERCTSARVLCVWRVTSLLCSYPSLLLACHVLSLSKRRHAADTHFCLFPIEPTARCTIVFSAPVLCLVWHARPTSELHLGGLQRPRVIHVPLALQLCQQSLIWLQWHYLWKLARVFI